MSRIISLNRDPRVNEFGPNDLVVNTKTGDLFLKAKRKLFKIVSRNQFDQTTTDSLLNLLSEASETVESGSKSAKLRGFDIGTDGLYAIRTSSPRTGSNVSLHGGPPFDYGQPLPNSPYIKTNGGFDILMDNANEYSNSAFRVFKNTGIAGVAPGVELLKLDENGNLTVSGSILTSGSGGNISGSLTISGNLIVSGNSTFNDAITIPKLVKIYFDDDGFPLSRNPNDLIFFTKYLLLCKECIKDAQQYVPDFLETIIDKNLICLKNILTPNDNVPLFNGGTEENLDELIKFINKLEYKTKDKKKLIGGILIFNYKNNEIFIDTGEPPQKKFSSSYQSGPLSFEYYVDGIKIITNCGFGAKISKKAELLSRLTSAQSTLTVNDTSVTKFERNKIINKIFGNSIKDSFKIFDVNYEESANHIKLIASHNGYERKFGCTHKREISINKDTNSLVGVDELKKRKDGKPINYSIRFHLCPGLTAVKTMSGNSVLIQLSKNKSLIFTIDNESIVLEKSIFLGGNKILENTCVTVSGNLVNKDKSIHWEIKKKI